MGDGVLAKGDTGTCDEDLRLGERTALSFGMSPWRAPGRPRPCALGELGDEAGLLLTDEDD